MNNATPFVEFFISGHYASSFTWGSAFILPELWPQVWDTSQFISGHSFIGETLSVLIGYTPRPTGMELTFYVAVLLTVGMLYKNTEKFKGFFTRQSAPA